MVKALICGYYGAHNRGDDLILKVLVDYLKRKGADVTVTSLDPASTSRDFGVRAIRSSRSLRRGLWTFVREAWRADLFILGGGGLYQDYGKHFRVVLFYGLRVLIAGLMGKKIAYFALGVGNIGLARSRSFIRLVTRFVHLITVRDAGSRQTLSEIGVTRDITVCADPVFSLAVPPPGPHAGGPGARLRVGISVMPYDGQLNFATGADRTISTSITEFTRYLLSQGHEVTFVPMEEGVDDRFIAELVAQASFEGAVCVLDASLDHDRFLEALARLDVVVAMRLHAIILSSVLGIPFVPISYHSKVANTVARLEQDDLMIGLDELSPERLRASFGALTENYQDRKASVASRAAALRREAEKVFTCFDGFV